MRVRLLICLSIFAGLFASLMPYPHVSAEGDGNCCCIEQVEVYKISDTFFKENPRGNPEYNASEFDDDCIIGFYDENRRAGVVSLYGWLHCAPKMAHNIEKNYYRISYKVEHINPKDNTAISIKEHTDLPRPLGSGRFGFFTSENLSTLSICDVHCDVSLPNLDGMRGRLTVTIDTVGNEGRLCDCCCTYTRDILFVPQKKRDVTASAFPAQLEFSKTQTVSANYKPEQWSDSTFLTGLDNSFGAIQGNRYAVYISERVYTANRNVEYSIEDEAGRSTVRCVCDGTLTESAPYDYPAEKLYTSLPDSPSQQDIDRLYECMKEHAEITLPPLEEIPLHYYEILKIFGDDLFSDRFITREIYLAVPHELRKMGLQSYLPTEKSILLMLSLARLVLEGKPSAKYADADIPAKRRLTALALTNFCAGTLIRSARPCLHSVRSLDPFLSEQCDKFLSQSGLIEWLTPLVRDEFAKLSIEGDTLPERIAKWRVLYDDKNLGEFTKLALESWLFINVKPESLLNGEEFDIPIGLEGRERRLVEYYGNIEIFKDILPLFNPNGYLQNWFSEKSASLLISLMMYARLDEFSTCKLMPYVWGELFTSFNISLCEPRFVHFLLPEALERSRPIMQRAKIYIYDYGYKNIMSSVMPRLVAEGRSGEAWFCGSYSNFAEEQAYIETDNIYPQYQIVANNLGYWVLGAYGVDFRKLFGILGHFEWDSKYYRSEEHARFLRRHEIDLDIALPSFPDQVADIVKDGWGQRYIKGLRELNPRSIGLKQFTEHFVPAVYYRYAATKWRLYVLSQYMSYVDTFWLDEAVCLIEVLPLDGEKPVEARLGLLYKGFDNWLNRSCTDGMKGQIWCGVEYKNAPENVQLFERAMQLCDENAKDRNERWNKNFREMNKKLQMENRP